MRRSTSLPTPQSPRAYEPKYPTRRTPPLVAAASSAQARTAVSTSMGSGHLRTDERSDLTGRPDPFLALGDLDRQIIHQSGHDVPRGLLPEVEVKALQRLLCRLV
jgi:hypothetical protein